MFLDKFDLLSYPNIRIGPGKNWDLYQSLMPLAVMYNEIPNIYTYMDSKNKMGHP
jgi:hypothetical protein